MVSLSQQAYVHNGKPILTARVGKNAEVYADILRLYVPTGSTVCDFNYGRGWFWKQTKCLDYTIVAVEIDDRIQDHIDLFRYIHLVKADNTATPFKDASFDAVTIDPPYAGLGGRHKNDGIYSSYNLSWLENVKRADRKKYLNSMYEKGLSEAYRVLKPSGCAITKCQDMITEAVPTWGHIEIFNYALSLGFQAEDLFVVIQEKTPIMRHNFQKHARKNHSFFWVFRKK